MTTLKNDFGVSNAAMDDYLRRRKRLEQELIYDVRKDPELEACERYYTKIPEGCDGAAGPTWLKGKPHPNIVNMTRYATEPPEAGDFGMDPETSNAYIFMAGDWVLATVGVRETPKPVRKRLFPRANEFNMMTAWENL